MSKVESDRLLSVHSANKEFLDLFYLIDIIIHKGQKLSWGVGRELF